MNFPDILSTICDTRLPIPLSAFWIGLTLLLQWPPLWAPNIYVYKSRSIGYNFNWCWQHALHLKKKTLPIFENLVTTSRTTTKVVSCLKIPLTSMCVVVRTSSPGSRLRQFFPTSPPPELVFQSIEETLLQPVLKTFITVFIQYSKGLENKLTRDPF